MTLGEKIQKLRKENNLSQEQLAEALCVSRQALSKWELGNSIPEVEKIILISNYFKVSTDYLLKDESDKEVQLQQNGEVCNSNIAAIASSAVIVIGLILGWARGNDGSRLVYLAFPLIAPGLIAQVIGIVSFEILSSRQKGKRSKALRYLFYGVNIWFLAVLPVIFIVGRFFTFIVHSYPGYLPYKYMIVAYFTVASIISIFCFLCYNNVKKRLQA